MDDGGDAQPLQTPRPVAQSHYNPYFAFENEDTSGHPKLLHDVGRGIDCADSVLNNPLKHTRLNTFTIDNAGWLSRDLLRTEEHLSKIIDNPYAEPKDKMEARRLMKRFNKRRAEYLRIFSGDFSDGPKYLAAQQAARAKAGLPCDQKAADLLRALSLKDSDEQKD